MPGEPLKSADGWESEVPTKKLQVEIWKEFLAREQCLCKGFQKSLGTMEDFAIFFFYRPAILAADLCLTSQFAVECPEKIHEEEKTATSSNVSAQPKIRRQLSCRVSQSSVLPVPCHIWLKEALALSWFGRQEYVFWACRRSILAKGPTSTLGAPGFLVQGPNGRLGDGR